MTRTTEQASLYDNLQDKTFEEIINDINREDQKVALAVQAQKTSIAALANEIFLKMSKGGRLFYIGAGTSGRLGVLDASECPPTFGVDSGKVIGLIAGGDHALRNAVEQAEDDFDQAWKDLEQFKISEKDVLIGIAASGSTPYVVGGLNRARKQGLITGAIVCNPGSKVAQEAEFPVEVIVGPEYVTGSTRMKSGTAQKMVLNMLSTSVMIKLGHVKGNRMVDMKLSNDKLVERGTRMVSDALDIEPSKAQSLLLKHGSVRKAIEHGKK